MVFDRKKEQHLKDIKYLEDASYRTKSEICKLRRDLRLISRLLNNEKENPGSYRLYLQRVEDEAAKQRAIYASIDEQFDPKRC